MDSILLRLLIVFVPLSFLSVGGGQSIIADIHRQSVGVYGWMTDARFLDLFGLSRMTPGPGSLLVTLVGWQAAGWAGALVATAAIFVPSSLLVYGLARLWARYRGAPWQRAVEAGLAASFTLLQAAEGGVLAWAMAAIACLALLFTRVSPFLLLGAGAVLFLLVQP
jgi:chromate transporter